MSEGASVESGLVVVIVVKLGSEGPRVNLSTPAVPTATPSITYSGWLSPLVEVTPRICTAIAPPGAPIRAEHRHPDAQHRVSGRRIGHVARDRARRGLRGQGATDERPAQHEPGAGTASHDPASLRLRAAAPAAVEPQRSAELEAPIPAVEGEWIAAPRVPREHGVGVESAPQPHALGHAVAQPQQRRKAAVAHVQAPAVRVPHVAAAQQHLGARPRRKRSDEAGVHGRVPGRPRHVQLEREVGPHVHRAPCPHADRVVEPQAVVEIGVACEGSDLDRAGALGRQWQGCGERYRGGEPNHASHHEDPPVDYYRARFVVMTITPLAPREPYTPVDPASLSTSIRATSPGARPASVLPTASREMGMPSMTTSGSSSSGFPRMLRWPRMRSW